MTLKLAELTGVNKKLPDFKAQINYYRSVQQFKYNHNKGRKRKTNLSDDGNTTEQSQVLNQNKVLIIGDSMLKNIDNVRIERACRGKASSHSYSGATITNLHNKIKDNWSNKGQCYSAILIHAGTNDLVSDCGK